MKRTLRTGLVLALTTAIYPSAASADQLTFTGTGPKAGLSATADFTLLNATTLKIVLTNTSTSLPAALDNGDSSSNRLLTSLAFRLPGMLSITGGSAFVAPGSSVNHAPGPVPAGNIGQEWGFGASKTGQCCEVQDPLHTYNDWISTLTAGTTEFVAGSLDTSDLNGPKWGLSSTALPSSLSSIKNSATYTLALSGGVPDLSFLNTGAIVEFGSDAAFLTVDNFSTTSSAPEPGAMALLGLAAAGWYRFRRKA